MPKDFDTAICELGEIAINIKSPCDGSDNLWSSIVENYDEFGAINYSYCTPVEKMVKTYVNNQSEENKRNMWLGTETAMINGDEDSSPFHIQDIEMDLEICLFDSIMRQAHDESTQLRKKKKTKRILRKKSSTH